MQALLLGLGPPWLAADEGPATFTPRDVLGHLIRGEETDWIPRIEIILKEGEARPFTPFDRFDFRSLYGGWSTPQLLARFAELRAQNLRRLESLKLSPADLDRGGTHPELGRVTLSELLATWVAHDLGHIAQVVRVMARRYRGEVGPWRAYLGLLKE